MSPYRDHLSADAREKYDRAIAAAGAVLARAIADAPLADAREAARQENAA